MVTGTSVLGITFNGGVMIAADTLGNVCMCICIVYAMLVSQILSFMLYTAHRIFYSQITVYVTGPTKIIHVST